MKFSSFAAPVAACALGAFAFVGALRPTLYEQIVAPLNEVRQAAPYAIDDDVRRAHEALFVADLHADPLLWPRDLSVRGHYGQVDIPRLHEAHVGLQVFGLVTQSPEGQNFEQNDASSDRIRTLAMASLWPPQTWTSMLERALHQCGKLDALVADSGNRMLGVRTRADLAELRERRAQGDVVLGAVLGLEGMHALQGDPANLQRLFDAGVRMLGVTHFIDNHFAGSAHGVEQGGLSDDGRAAVLQAQDLGMAIDIAHLSPAAISDVLDIATKPVVSSHTGVRGTCDSSRNLSDAQLRRVADNGGVVGIALFRGAVCGDTIEATLDAIDHAVSVAGVAHVGLGSDFDGAVTTPVDVTGLPLITGGLIERGYSTEDVAAIMGENVARVLAQTLPD